MDTSGLARITPADVQEFIQLYPRTVLGAGIAAGTVALYGLARWYFAGGWCYSDKKLDGKTVIVTGGNCGIGKETARDMARRGARVILACRDIMKGERAAVDIRRTTGNSNVIVLQCDLASLESIQKFAADLLRREQHIDILINNAGIMMTNADHTTVEGFEMQIGVNHLGHFLLTNLLLDKIKKSRPARIVNVSSLAYKYGRMNFNDINMTTSYDSFKSYGQSKLANILFTKELARRLEGTEVTSYSVHPGVVQTNLGRHVGTTLALWKRALLYPLVILAFKTPQQGAQTTIYCAVQEGIEQYNGRYFSDCKPQTLQAHAEDLDDARRLWELSAHMVRLDS